MGGQFNFLSDIQEWRSQLDNFGFKGDELRYCIIEYLFTQISLRSESLAMVKESWVVRVRGWLARY